MNELLDIKELEGLSEQEKNEVLKILKEYSTQGKSESYNELLYEDYAEIPVDIETFVDDYNYLGNAWHDKDGNTKLYPYWRKELRKIFPDNLTTTVNNAIFSGSRGRGKSEISCLCMAYMLHRVLCLKDPVSHFHLKPTEKIVFAFMNIKLSLAEEIGNSKFQNTLLSSPWFISHGEVVGRTKKLWVPKKYNGNVAIDIKIGSQADDLIGLPIYACLDGDTIINTTTGDYKIKELVGKPIRVKNIDQNGNIITSDECTVAITSKSKEEYEIELEDGTIIKCTPNHKLMLKDGAYKEIQYLTKDDELFYINIHKKNLKNIKIKLIRKNILKTTKQYYDVINANPYNNFLIKTKDRYIVSHNCFCDEISFQRNMDIDKQKEKAYNLIDTAIGGMKTRFVYKGINPTLLILSSSRRSEKSFLEEHMKKKLEHEKENVYISDGSVWQVKPEGTYKKETFKVAIGNKFLQSLVIPDNEDYHIYEEKGYKILDVPADFKSDFLDDIDRALCDFAGISSSEISKYINANAVKEIITDTYKNPFTKEIIEVGNNPQDKTQYYDYFDLNKVPQKYKNKPLFIHLDMSITGDMTGISGVWITGKKVADDSSNQAKDLFFTLAFSVSVRAPKGYQVSFEKNRNFIRWLKQQGFKIKKVTSDTFQSYDLQQQLKAEGFDCAILSVDRVDTNSHICIPYQYFRSAIYEKRIQMFKDDELFGEIIDLERNINTGKIDHPDFGKKDACDSFAGSIYSASQYAEEYAFDYGESVELMLQGNKATTTESNQQQLQVAFEEELMKMFNPMANQIQQQNKEQEKETSKDNKIENKEQENNAKFKSEKQSEKPKEKSPYIDFGLGAAKVLPGSQYINNGIMFW